MRKKIRRSFFMITLIVFVLISGGVGGIYLWISDWTNICTKEEMNFNAQIVNNTPELAPNFYQVWDKLFPGSRQVSMTQQSRVEFLNGIGLLEARKDCKCDEVAFNSWNNHDFEWKFNHKELLGKAGYRKFGFGLNAYSTPEKCFDFWVNYDFFYSKEWRYFNGLNEFSNLLYQKGISELSEEETIEVIAYRLMMTYEGPSSKEFIRIKEELMKKWEQQTSKN